MIKYKIIFGFFLLGLLLISGRLVLPTSVFFVETGKVHFTSDAPLELIQAESDALKGVIDIEKRTFAFSVEVRSFQGFNSPLQREHFNENYMESHRFKDITFTGKIIEKMDLSQPGVYQVRAKGLLNVHGITQERIIKSELKVTEKGISLQSEFRVLLKEHQIEIPRIVYQKIAEEIKVQVEAFLVGKTEKID